MLIMRGGFLSARSGELCHSEPRKRYDEPPALAAPAGRAAIARNLKAHMSSQDILSTGLDASQFDARQ